MPKVMISVSERVTYSREVEMTDAEFREWDDRLDLRGAEFDKALENMTQKFIRRPADWQDAGDLRLEDMSVVLED